MVSRYKQEFVEFMVRCGVLTFGDFTAKSGRKTPYFVNTGKYNSGAQLMKLGEYYAECIMENGLQDMDALFGPAYKGIPLCAAASIALCANHGVDMGYCFNRKEVKDHGEGGSIVGKQLKDGDSVIIIEDVVTAGTSVGESVPLLHSLGDVNISALVISVDRMERGKGELSAVQEIKQLYGIPAYPIVTIREVIEALYNHPVDGKIYINEETRARIEDYLKLYGAK